MRVHDVMNDEIQTVSPDAKIVDVARMMREGDFGVVPVTQNTKPVGMITDRDIVIRAVADGKDITKCVAADCMTKDVLTCNENDDVDEVAQMMSDQQVRRIVVLDGDDQICGIVSLGDLSKRDEQEAGQALQDISQPSRKEPRAH